LVNDEGRRITCSDGRKFEFIEDSGITVIYRIALDVTEENHTRSVLMGMYKTKKGEKVFITEDQAIFDVFADVAVENS